MSAAPASGLHSQGRCLTSIISILEREHEGGFGHSSPSRNTATVPPDALCGRGRARGEVATPNSLQLHHDCAFRDSWSGHTSFAGILGDPLSCCPSALVGTSLVLVDRDREPSASGAHEGIAHETLYPPDETFHFSFVLLQEVEKRLSPFARIVSYHSMHDTLPTAEHRYNYPISHSQSVTSTANGAAHARTRGREMSKSFGNRRTNNK